MISIIFMEVDLNWFHVFSDLRNQDQGGIKLRME